jgi:hypothetical protein
MWKQKGWISSTALQNITCGTALNIGSIVCSCVCILKAIIVNFLNLLNRKIYRNSLFFSSHTSYIRTPLRGNNINYKNTIIEKVYIYLQIYIYQTPQIVSTYVPSTLHDITEGSSISISSTHAFLFFMPYRRHP